METKRVTLFCGHYGSGKTNLAVNYAMRLRAQGLPVSLADVDIVNPYFRSKDSEEALASMGIEVISLPFANTNVDLPSLPSEVYGLVERRDRYAVLDVGGDDRGAYALGRFASYILRENDFEMLYVVNFYRPLTQTAAEALEVMREIEAVCAIPFTGIVNNSNLGDETKGADVRKTDPEAQKLCALAGLPLKMTAVSDRCAADFPPGAVFPLHLQKKPF
ncbi:MAG: hypothetical protein IJT27_02445 [Clostridia bacterium]|nr:hypothetical protein [Clostridia bacterium]